MSTIRHVAKLAGVSVATVSRAMSGSPLVSEAARAAVDEAAKALNYRPSSIARALSNRRSSMLGVLTPRFDGAYYSTALDVAEREIRKANKHLVVATARGRSVAEPGDKEALQFLYERDCDGLLLLGSSLSERDIILLAEKGKPIALVNRHLASMPANCFSVDHRAAGRKVAEHLVAAGHTQMASISGPLHIEDARLRHLGFVEGLEAAGLALDSRLDVQGDYRFASGRAGADRILSSGLPFTAVFCGNDEMALSAKVRFDAANLDPTVFGYDNMSMVDYIGIDINSVSVPIEDVVSNACMFLLNICDNTKTSVKYEFQTELVIREK